MKMASPDEADAVTGVLWNLNECPVPRDVDARMVGPCIKRFVESYGYMGPLTITAIGVLTDFPDSILRGLYSGGINLSHFPAGYMKISNHITLFTEMNPPRANIIWISDPDPGLATTSFSPSHHIRSRNGFWKPHHQILRRKQKQLILPTGSALYATVILLPKMLDWLNTPECFYAPPSPLNSRSRSRSPLKDVSFMSLSLPPTEPPEIDHQAVTCVFWDINKCPVPRDVDARLVCPSIKRFLETSGYSGPVTINAVGVLTDVPIDILRGVCSSGIALVNVPHGSTDILVLRSEFTKNNPPPANFVIISDQDSYFQPLPRYGQFLLPSLPTDVGELDDGKCSETGECSCHVCSGGYPGLSFQSFDNFATHLSSRAHQRKMLDWVPRSVRVSRQLTT
ncbi:unnamed protein product [Arabis nemorensis]|uniref:NYN domain-containing protein n=1 Tax=Arabis nemorensis TaxID=586526 RepID=A0A565AMS3_9BRAS|nr:unnamed protein product [Arabis nemorensis]